MISGISVTLIELISCTDTFQKQQNSTAYIEKRSRDAKMASLNTSHIDTGQLLVRLPPEECGNIEVLKILTGGRLTIALTI